MEHTETSNSKCQASLAPSGNVPRRSPWRALVAGNQGCWPLLAFLAISLLASSLQDIRFMALVPENIRLVLGHPPAPHLTGLLLSAYFVSSLAVSCHGIFIGTRPYPAWVQLGLLSFFYFLYFSADALDENLLAVFVAGSILVSLDLVRLRVHTRRMNGEGERNDREPDGCGKN